MSVKMFVLILGLGVSVSAFADGYYTCSSDEAENVALPQEMFLSVEGQNVVLENSSTDIAYDGKITTVATGDACARGFDGLLGEKKGFVLLSQGLIAGSPSGDMIIHDDSRDSTETVYRCDRDAEE